MPSQPSGPPLLVNLEPSVLSSQHRTVFGTGDVPETVANFATVMITFPGKHPTICAGAPARQRARSSAGYRNPSRRPLCRSHRIVRDACSRPNDLCPIHHPTFGRFPSATRRVAGRADREGVVAGAPEAGHSALAYRPNGNLASAPECHGGNGIDAWRDAAAPRSRTRGVSSQYPDHAEGGAPRPALSRMHAQRELARLHEAAMDVYTWTRDYHCASKAIRDRRLVVECRTSKPNL